MTAQRAAPVAGPVMFHSKLSVIYPFSGPEPPAPHAAARTGTRAGKRAWVSSLSNFPRPPQLQHIICIIYYNLAHWHLDCTSLSTRPIEAKSVIAEGPDGRLHETCNGDNTAKYTRQLEVLMRRRQSRPRRGSRISRFQARLGDAHLHGRVKHSLSHGWEAVISPRQAASRYVPASPVRPGRDPAHPIRVPRVEEAPTPTLGTFESAPSTLCC